MFYLVGYDLRKPRYDKALERGIKSCATKIQAGKKQKENCTKIIWGPWLLESARSQAEIRNDLRRHLRAADKKRTKKKRGRFNDKLLVVPLGGAPDFAGPSAKPVVKPTGRIRKNFDEALDWFVSNIGAITGSNVESGRILAITYTLSKATAKDHREVRKAIWKNFPDCANPVHALWFVRSNKTATEAYREISRHLPKKHLPEHGLLVIQVGADRTLSDLDHVRHDPFWLWQNGIASEHTLLETSTPRSN